ncbi:MAG TPA: hypothetical protein VG713_06920 [Pirellulales bacterium]|nr:hypothetical protein [Pirellulales bacterium]
MGITYDGSPLLLEDPDGLFSGWIDRYQSMADLCMLGQPTAFCDGQFRPRYSGPNDVGLPQANLDWLPRPKLNRLWWPTGASRFAIGLFIADETQVAGFLDDSDGGTSPLELSIEDANGGLAVDMYMLPPRPVSCSTTTDRLYVLTLVDERYFWQQRNVGQLTVARDKDWGWLFGQLGSALGVSIETSDVNSAYKHPDPAQFSRRYANAAMLLDAAARSVGQRITRNPANGNVYSDSWEQASDDFDSNLQNDYIQVAGGQLAGLGGNLTVIPEKVMVVFRKYYHGGFDAVGDRYMVQKSASAYLDEVNGFSGLAKTIYSTAFANFSSGGSTADNDSAVTALADRIASDFYASLGKRFDYTFAGYMPWTPTAFDDHMEIVYGADPTGGYRFWTRVQSLPYSYGPEQQLSQLDDVSVWPSPHNFEIYSDWSGSSGQAKHSDNAYDGNDTKPTFTMYDANDIFSGNTTGKKGTCYWNEVNKRWEELQRGC